MVFLKICSILIVIGLVFFTLGCGKEKPKGEPKPPEYFPLSDSENAKLDKMREVIYSVLKEKYGVEKLSNTKEDLVILQRLVDDQVFGKDQIYEWNSLGVVFGDVLAFEIGLEWWIVKDEFGVDPVLRYKETSIQLGALTMLSKRIEENREIDLEGLFQGMSQTIGEIIKEKNLE